MKNTRFGISSYAFPVGTGVVPDFYPEHLMTRREVLELAVELGAPVVQLANNLPLDAAGGEELDDLVSYSRAHGLSLEVGCQGLRPERLERYLDIACRLGAHLMRCTTGSPDFDPTMAEAEHILRGILPRLEEYDLVLGIENYDRHSTAEMADLLGRLDNPHFGAVLDTTNSLSREEPISLVLEHLARYTVCLHLKNYAIRRRRGGSGLIICGTPLNEGRLDIPAILRAVREQAQQDFSTILERWSDELLTPEASARREIEWVRRDLAYLRALPEGN